MERELGPVRQMLMGYYQRQMLRFATEADFDRIAADIATQVHLLKMDAAAAERERIAGYLHHMAEVAAELGNEQKVQALLAAEVAVRAGFEEPQP